MIQNLGGDDKTTLPVVVVSICFELHFLMAATLVVRRRWETISGATLVQRALQLGDFESDFE